MGQLVTPKVYWVGHTSINDAEILQYLKDSGNDDFWQSIVEARTGGLSDAEIICSLFAKLCYKSLTLGKNQNITRVRDITDNLKGCFDVGHGSIFEHINFNFIITDCSRVFTHELVRHRIGTAFSQNSGRYIRLDQIDLVYDPCLEPVKEDILETIAYLEHKYAVMTEKLNLESIKDFTTKKKLTSAMRRIAPNGQSNEIGFTVNLRSLRHTIMLRTNRHAEWEIRVIFANIYLILKDKYPLIFYGAKEEVVDGILEITNMKMQPYEKSSAQHLQDISTEEIEAELALRQKERLS
jgi:thymidylate synthase (FAD)